MVKKILLGGVASLFVLGNSASAATFDIVVDYLPAGETVDYRGDGPETTEAFTVRQKELFGVAENFWESVLTGFSGLVDPVLNMTASLASVDGSFGVLAFAGPTDTENSIGTNPTTGLAKTFRRSTDGIMQFDADDFGAAAAGLHSEKRFLDVAIHELAHAIGFGTLFDLNDLTNGSGNYDGGEALAAFNTTNGTTEASIRLTDGGGHWDECWVEGLGGNFCSGFNDPDLMTPFIFTPASIAPATIAAFADLGYFTVDPFSGVSLPDVPVVGAAVPLPAGLALLLTGLGGLGIARRRQKA